MFSTIPARAAGVLPIEGGDGFWSPLSIAFTLAAIAVLALVARWISGGRG